LENGHPQGRIERRGLKAIEPIRGIPVRAHSSPRRYRALLEWFTYAFIGGSLANSWLGRGSRALGIALLGGNKSNLIAIAPKRLLPPLHHSCTETRGTLNSALFFRQEGTSGAAASFILGSNMPFNCFKHSFEALKVNDDN
jgi:hypothetical protein